VPAWERIYALVRESPLPAVVEALAVGGGRVRECVDADAQTLLSYAVQRESQALEVCRLLCEDYQVPVDRLDASGQSVMHSVAATGNVQCLNYLVSRRCDVDCVDMLMGQTPLFLASSQGSISMMQRLLAMGADHTLRDAHGKTAVSWATSVDKCKVLAERMAVDFAAGDARAVANTVVEWHRKGRRQLLAKFYAICVEAWLAPRQMSWVAREDNQRYSAYVTMLARQRDVAKLCELEDEFIADHRAMFSDTLSDAEFFNQIGLNPDAEVRKSTVKWIAQGVPQSAPLRHYTLACIYMPDNPRGTSGTARARSHQVVGYTYFKILDGVRKESDEESPSSPSAAPGQAKVGYVVISHIKVAREHQHRGVARLLLAGALRVAVKEAPGITCRNLHLSVVATNSPARKLYEKLGFVPTLRSKHVGWVSMRREIEPSTNGLAREWMETVWARSNEHVEMRDVNEEGDSSADDVVPQKRRRTLSPSASTVSDVSSSAFSLSSLASSSYSASSPASRRAGRI